jgi:hypothetical protein
MVIRLWDTRTGAKVGNDLALPGNPGQERWGVSAIEFGSDTTLLAGGLRTVRR